MNRYDDEKDMIIKLIALSYLPGSLHLLDIGMENFTYKIGKEN